MSLSCTGECKSLGVAYETLEKLNLHIRLMGNPHLFISLHPNKYLLSTCDVQITTKQCTYSCLGGTYNLWRK